MVHLKSLKFSDENEYADYIVSRAGDWNAKTDNTSTNYHFEITACDDRDDTDEPPPLYGALDRFAQLFMQPLFQSEVIDRELHAVDSECRNAASEDGTRVWQVVRSESNPNHPWCSFPLGNLDTLKTGPEAQGVNVRDNL